MVILHGTEKERVAYCSIIVLVVVYLVFLVKAYFFYLEMDERESGLEKIIRELFVWDELEEAIVRCGNRHIL